MPMSTSDAHRLFHGHQGLKKALAVALSLLMIWQLFGYDFPLYADTIASALSRESEYSARSAGDDDTQSLGLSGTQEAGGYESGSGSDGDSGDAIVAVGQDPEDTDDAEPAIEPDAHEGQAGDPDDEDATGARNAGGGADAEDEETREWQAPDILRDGHIHLAAYAQLQAIGTGDPVTTTDREEGQFGVGEVVEDADGNVVAYALDASYYLDDDIELPEGGAWQLPEEFGGSFSGPDDADGSLAERLYDPDTDTIYIQNPYQLDILASEDRDEMPVMTGDVAAGTFGSGNLVFPDGSLDEVDAEVEGSEGDVQVLGEDDADGQDSDAEGFLTYDESHSYVLSRTFTSERKSLRMLKAAGGLRANGATATGPNANHVEGRDYFGQVTKEIGDKTYILIGDRQQLDAINNAGQELQTAAGVNQTFGNPRVSVCGPVFKATEGTVEVYRSGSSGPGDWIWLSQFDGSRVLKNGNGYGSTAEEVMASYQNLAFSAEVIYPGDADLVSGIHSTNGGATSTKDFSASPLYDVNSNGYHKLDRPAGTATGQRQTREVYFTTNDTTHLPDITTATLTASDPKIGTLKYTRDENYIVFRDINMTKGYAPYVSYGTLADGDWKPLMFGGTMYGIKADNQNDQSTLWSDTDTQPQVTTDNKPNIQGFNIVPIMHDGTELDVSENTGVGFFGTLMGETGVTAESDVPVIVSNLLLSKGTVVNTATEGYAGTSLVDWLLGEPVGRFVTGLLDLVLRPVLSLLGLNLSLQELLKGILDARKDDPASLATGAFAGRIYGPARITDCEVDDSTVDAVETHFDADEKIVGVGGFVGSVEGETKYKILGDTVDALVDLLTGLLNIIPFVGLGDLITVLLNNAIPLAKLLPTGYVAPEISRCTVKDVDVLVDSDDAKYGVGGFVGSSVGSVISDSKVIRTENHESMSIHAETFGGGFCGILRDSIIQTTLSGLVGQVSDNIIRSIHPQGELINCSIENAQLTVEGGDYLGGFVGAMADSYGINCTIDGESTTVSADGSYAGGYAGYAQIGSVLGLGRYLKQNEELIGNLSGAVTNLLSSGDSTSSALLELGGAAPSAILGFVSNAELYVSAGNSYAGGIVGSGEGTVIAKSSASNIRDLVKYERDTSLPLPIAADDARDNDVSNVRSISAGKDYAGGVAGKLTSAKIAGVATGAVGVISSVEFEVSDTNVYGMIDVDQVPDGYAVQVGDDYAGGAIGWAAGGTVRDANIYDIRLVQARNLAGGFVGETGPGNIVGAGGIDVQLFKGKDGNGLSLVKVDNLLSLADTIRTTFLRANVEGIESGFTVVAKGLYGSTATDEEDENVHHVAGGWAASANSVKVVDSKVENLLSVTANMSEAAAGGFVGYASAGGLAGVGKDGDTGSGSVLQLANLGDIVSAVPYLVPSFDGCSTTYVHGGYVKADAAGGFAGEFQSGTINTNVHKRVIDNDVPIETPWNPIDDVPYTQYDDGTTSNPYSVFDIDHVYGGRYAGGWGGRVYAGALADAGSGLSLLGGNVAQVDNLLSAINAYVPTVTHAGVKGVQEEGYSKNGYKVFAAHVENGVATEGKAGGFIGYGSGAQVSYSDVDYLRQTEPKEPDALTDGSAAGYGNDRAAYRRIGIYPDPLESQDGRNYMDFGAVSEDLNNVPYAVAGVTHAGGYIGHMDVGNAASVGDSIGLFSGFSGDLAQISGLLSAVDAAVAFFEHSDVKPTPGGYSVVASSHIHVGDKAYDAKGVGYAGGFAGQMEAGQIQDCNSYNFYYIVGEVAAGGYVAEMKPGSIANVLDEGSVSLLGLLDADSLLTIGEDFVPTIRNSETTCVPCGGAVRAEKRSDENSTEGGTVRGMAGGYVGHNVGGRIWGMDRRDWKGADVYLGGTGDGPRECAAIRIRSVYGAEYAGGFCGLMECGSTANTGSLSLLGGLLSATNLLSALKVVYATIESGAVYGPLYGVDEQTWNAWKRYVGVHGGFASELAALSYAEASQLEYGTNVVAGRHVYNPYVTTALAGCAGGFVGSMFSGAISGAELIDEIELDHPSKAQDTKLVLGMRAAGGFAGEMQTKGLANFGSVGLFGQALQLNVGNLLDVAQVLVPVISTSGTFGYQAGMRVGATGSVDDADSARQAGVGCAGGYVGGCYGGQIGLSDDEANIILDAIRQATETGEAWKQGLQDTGGAWVRMLKQVKGTLHAGGFVGRTSSAAVVNADTDSLISDNSVLGEALNGVVNDLVSTPGDLLSVLDATVATIKYAKVSASDPNWGIVVDGTYRDRNDNKVYAETAGGFAGSLEAAVVGELNNPLDIIVLDDLRGVVGGQYAGGFFGLADVGSVASVGGSGGTNLLNGLVSAGNIGVLDAFRTYIYKAQVTGVDDGIRVYAMDDSTSHGTMNAYYETGAAGGFGGALLNGTVEDSWVENLNYVESANYSGGFIGHSGKNGGVTAEEASLGNNNSILSGLLARLGLDLGAAAQLFNIVGSTIERCSVTGFEEGFVAKTRNAQTTANTGQWQQNIKGSCAAGFVGFADMAQIEDCEALQFKKAEGAQIAGGFVGRSSVGYIGNVSVDLTLVRGLLGVLNTLGVIPLLYAITNITDPLPKISLGGFEFDLLRDGNVLYHDLYGFKLGVSLDRAPAGTDLPDSITIVLGSSKITVPYSNEAGGGIQDDATIQLIEGNRTSIKNCTVVGITDGYDVFGAGTSQTERRDDWGEHTSQLGGKDVFPGVPDQPISPEAPAPVEHEKPVEPSLEDGETTESETYQARLQAYEEALATYDAEVLQYEQDVQVYEAALQQYEHDLSDYNAAMEAFKHENRLGYAGGFIGYNDNGFLSHDHMVLCDVVLGAPDLIGPYVGWTESEDSGNGSRPRSYLEGTANSFRIYRKYDASYNRLETSGGTTFNDTLVDGLDVTDAFRRVNESDTGSGTAWNRYLVKHLDVITQHADLEDATATGGEDPIELGAYASAAKAVLMDDTLVKANTKGDSVEPDELKDPCDDTFDLTVNKRWKDLFNLLGSRPDEITVYVYQVDAGPATFDDEGSITAVPGPLVNVGTPGPSDGTVTVPNPHATLRLSAETSGQPHTEAWKARVEDLPVAYHPNDDTSVTHYYRYFVSEAPLETYDTTYEINQSTATVTITNEYNQLLPDLGGEGGARLLSMTFLLVAAVSVCIVHRLRKRRREEVVE